jgi:hypothetical protein
MCSTDHFWQCCDIYRYENYRPFLTVLWYISICELVTISDTAVLYIDMFNTDYFWTCCYIYRYVKYRPFLTVLVIYRYAQYWLFLTVLLCISICAVLTISNSAVLYVDMCSTDYFWQCCSIYRYVQYWPFLSVLIYLSLCEIQTISLSGVIYIDMCSAIRIRMNILPQTLP